MNLRIESTGDRELIWALNAQAFKTTAEADLVDSLRCSSANCISIVAEKDELIVGHILFSSVKLVGSENKIIFGLAPMAVLPNCQNRGIGSALVELGLKECAIKGGLAVVVLGHPNYYPRFGFRPSEEFQIKSEYDVPDDVFMALELVQGSLNNVKGIIQYNDVFKNG